MPGFFVFSCLSELQIIVFLQNMISTTSVFWQSATSPLPIWGSWILFNFHILLYFIIIVWWEILILYSLYVLLLKAKRLKMIYSIWVYNINVVRAVNYWWYGLSQQSFFNRIHSIFEKCVGMGKYINIFLKTI